MTRLGHFQLVLGFPWLKRHNPRIDWAEGVLRFDSLLCTSTCVSLPSPPPSAPSFDPPPPTFPLPPSSLFGTTSSPSSTPHPHTNLFQHVPEAYLDYMGVFSESEANTLPPHRKYDLQTPLVPDAKPPWGPICGIDILVRSIVALDAMRHSQHRHVHE